MRVDAATSTWLQAEARTDFHAETANARRRPLPSPLWASALHDEFFAIAGGWAVTAYGIFPRHSVASCCAWASTPTSAQSYARTRIRLSSACTARSTRNACRSVCPSRSERCERRRRSFSSPTTTSVRKRRTACGNRPPHTAFPNLPALPPGPEQVNPDRWLEAIHGRAFARKVGADGSVDVDDEHYYISQALAGHEARACASMHQKRSLGCGWKAG